MTADEIETAQAGTCAILADSAKEELFRREVAASDARHLAGVLEHGGKLAPLGTINADGTTNVAVSSRRFDLLNEALCKLRKAAGLVPLEVDDGVA